MRAESCQTKQQGNAPTWKGRLSTPPEHPARAPLDPAGPETCRAPGASVLGALTFPRCSGNRATPEWRRDAGQSGADPLQLAGALTWVGLQVLNGSGQHFHHGLAGDIHLL